MIRNLLYGFLITVCISCTKKETVLQTQHVNSVVEGNTPPQYEGITKIVLQNYINKIYIDLLGREPNPTELDQKVNYLKDENVSENARITVVDALLSTPEYYTRLIEIYRQSLLLGIVDAEIQYLLDLIILQRDALIASGDIVLVVLFNSQIQKLQDLLTSDEDYANDVIDEKAFFSRCIDNPVYDDINMGSENFVLSCFEGLLKRNPTEPELTNSVLMVDNVASTLFLKNGSSKGDFVDIITSNSEFYQGMVIDIYQQLLARLPNSVEMATGSEAMQIDGENFQDIQRKVLITDEYAGIN